MRWEPWSSWSPTPGDEQISSADVLAVLGVADAEQLFEALDAVLAHDPAAALRCAAKLTVLRP